jgi:hypothetical protein
MQRFLGFLFLGALKEAGTTTSKTKFRVEARLLDYSLHVAPFLADYAPRYVKILIILDLYVEPTRVFTDEWDR